MSRAYRIDVPGQPQGKGRARAAVVGGRARMYTPEKTAAYEGLIALAARDQIGSEPPIEGPVNLFVDAYFAVPASWSRKKKMAALNGVLRPESKPDWDNIAKAVCDGLNGIAFVDDKQVVGANVRKIYSDRPRVEIIVSEI